MSALVASLFAVGAAPAAAVDKDSRANYQPSFSACVGPALEDAGFTDLGTLDAAVANINCLAYYRISAGYPDGTFNPKSNVTRSQMALFLYAAADRAGLDLMGGDMTADFGDISELGENRQNAINALARNGILAGRGDMTFDPYSDITRAEMAVALVNLVDKASGIVTKGADGLFRLGPAPGSLPNDSFDDAYALVPQPINNAISAAYELGITGGYPDYTFRPNDPVPRVNMATFIMNALNHTNLRPAGLTAQTERGTATVTVSMRDADFEPVANMRIDVFRANTDLVDRAFSASRGCTSHTTMVDGASKCAIDGADPVTQSDGNVELQSLSSALSDAGDNGLTVWSWSGDLTDRVGPATELYELLVTASDPTVEADEAIITTNRPKDKNGRDFERSHFGSTVTVTIQLVGDHDDNAATPSIPARPPRTGPAVQYTVDLQWFNTDRSLIDRTLGAPTQAADDVSGLSALNNRALTLTIGDDGSASFDVTVPDPDADPGDFNMRTVQYTVAPVVTNNPNNFPIATDNSPGEIVFSDEIPRVHEVAVTATTTQAASSSGGSVGTAVTATAKDQYGNPVRRAPITLHSSNAYTGSTDTDGGAAVPGEDARFTTSRSGTVRIGYTYHGGASKLVVKASWDGFQAARDLNNDDDETDAGEAAVGTDGFDNTVDTTEEGFASGAVTNQCAGQDRTSDATVIPVALGEDVCGEVAIYWAVAAGNGASAAARNVLSLDAANNRVVVDNGDTPWTPTWVYYDGNDYFNIVNASANTAVPATGPVTAADFASAVAAALAGSASGANGAVTLEWSSYIADDRSDIASLTLNVAAA